jgi:hypothetical protein
MAILLGTEILGAANVSAATYDTAITPAATPNGVCVIVIGNSAADLISSVTYGVAADAVTLSRHALRTETTEAGAVYMYWAGDSTTFPTGTQTVRITRTNSAISLRAAIWTMTCGVGKVVTVDSDNWGSSASVANPSWAHDSLAADVLAFLGIHSGLTTMTNTPAAGWTLAPTPGFEDYGAQGRGWARRTLAAAGSLGAGWTAATADDFVGSSIAFKETTPPPAGKAPPPDHPTRRIIGLLAA